MNVELEPEPLDEAAQTEEPPELDALEGIEAIRLRPGMYVGSIDADGLHHLFMEIIDNALAEVVAGHCTEISVVLGTDGSLSVQDEGRGIPVGTDDETGKTVVERVFTEFHWPKRFAPYTYEIPVNFGLGAAYVNALSEWIECEVRQGGRVYRQRFERGVPTGPLSVGGACGNDEHGTKVTWLADASIFTQALVEGVVNYDTGRLRRRLRELAFLNKNVTISFHDALHGIPPVTYHYPRGVADCVRELTAKKAVLHPDVIHFSHNEEGMEVEIALQFSSDADTAIYCYANNFHLLYDGTPRTGFIKDLTRILSRYARRHGYLAGADARFAESDTRRGIAAMVALAYPDLGRTRHFSKYDVNEGLTIVIAVRLFHPIFSGATRDSLANSEVGDLVDRVSGNQLSKFLDANPAAASAILAKACHAANTRKAV